MRLKDFIEIHDWTAAEVMEIFELAKEIKAKPKKFRDALEGQTLAMIFEKSSTRTRVSFEAGMFQLGGHALFLSSRDIQLGRGEPITDTARVLRATSTASWRGRSRTRPSPTSRRTR